MSTTSDNPSGSRVETYPPRAFIINMYNGYYRSFEDGYQTALVELEKLIESEHQQAILEVLEDLNERLAIAGDLRTARLIASDMLTTRRLRQQQREKE